jgi:hypothetical protein
MMKLNRYAKIVSPTSHKEFDRRHAAVQAKMKEKGIEGILLYGSYIRQCAPSVISLTFLPAARTACMPFCRLKAVLPSLATAM